jgi:hypothetical protein
MRDFLYCIGLFCPCCGINKCAKERLKLAQ